MVTFSAEDDLDVIWPKVVERIQKIADWELSTSSTLSPDEIVARINPPKREDGSTAGDKAKKVFGRTLVCIQTFGAIAASAASAVFGPSQQCMNAVSFVITATQRYSAVFEDITTLMERMSAFFEKLRVYLTSSATSKLNKHLRTQVFDVLAHFLEAMAICHKIITQRRAKVKLAFSVSIFGEDKGVRTALTTLERIISQVTSLEITVIASDLSEAAKNILTIERKVDQLTEASEATVTGIGQLINAEDRRSEIERERKETEAIRKALKIKENSRPWEDAHDYLKSTRFEGTGQWLLRHPTMKRWCQPNEQAVNVVTIQANQNFGKTYLCSVVADALREQHGQDPRVYVAHYYFNRDPSEVRDSVNKAIKAILWQFIHGEQPICREFRKAVAKTVDQKIDFNKTTEMWDRLLANQRSEQDGTLFIVLDGVNKPDSEADRPMASLVSTLMANTSSEGRFQVRLLLSGRSEGLGPIRDTVDLYPPEIAIAPPKHLAHKASNYEDLELYTSVRLKSMSRFQSPEFQALKERITTILTSGVKGDYYMLESKLKEIEQARLPSQIEDILKRADEDRVSVINRDIRNLNSELAPEEIMEANKILLWTLCAYMPLRVKDLAAILSLTQNPTSYVPLEQQIVERYSALFEVEKTEQGSFVTVGSHEIADYVGDPQRQAIEPAEIALVERAVKLHLARTFGDDEDLYAKYGLAAFFESKRLPPATQIRFNKKVAHGRAAYECLVALCDKVDDDDFAPFHTYAFEFFADHLIEQMRFPGALESADLDLAHSITRKLVRLLYDPFITREWVPRWLTRRTLWVSNKWGATSLWNWILGSEYKQALADMPVEGNWIRDLDDRDAKSIELLTPVALAIAMYWREMRAENDDLDSDLPFRWLRSFLDLFLGEQDNLQADDNKSVSVQAIEEVESWARQQIQDGDHESQWHYCVALTLADFSHHAEALTRFDRAIELQPGRWKTQYDRCSTLDALGREGEAVKSLAELVESARGSTSADGVREISFWVDLLPSLSRRYINLHDYGAATAVNQEMLDRFYAADSPQPYAVGAIEDMLTIYEATEEYDKATDFVRSLMTRWEGDHVFLSLLKDSSVIILATVRSVETRSKAISMFEKIIDDVDGLAKPADWMDFKSALAVLKWRGSFDDREAAYDIFTDLVDFPSASFPQTAWELFELRCFAAADLSEALLKDFLDPMRDEEGRANILKRLEDLTHMDHFVVRDPGKDTRLALARALCISGQASRAKEVLRGYLGLAIQMAQAKSGYDLEDQRRGMFRIVNMFTHLNDDANAIAAWGWLRTLARRINASSVTPVTPTTGEQQESSERTEPGDSVSSGQGSEQAPEAGDDHAIAGAVDNDAATQANEATSVATELRLEIIADEASQPSKSLQVSSAASQPNEDKLISPLSLAPENGIDTNNGADDIPDEFLHGVCDGCDKQPLYKEEFYFCRGCLEIILCADCHRKSKDGTMYRLLCSQQCSHLRLPPLERHWKHEGDEVLWEGELVKLDVWLDGIKKEWGIEEKKMTPREHFRAAVWKVRVGLRLDRDFKAKFEERSDET